MKPGSRGVGRNLGIEARKERSRDRTRTSNRDPSKTGGEDLSGGPVPPIPRPLLGMGFLSPPVSTLTRGRQEAHEYLLCNGLSVGYLGEIKGFLGDEGHLAGPGWKPGDLLSLLGETQEEPQEESESESGQSEKRSQRSGGQNIYFVTPPCFIRVPPGFRRALDRPHGAMPSPLCPLPDGASGTSQAAGPHLPPPG